jgi:hypothetical protein
MKDYEIPSIIVWEHYLVYAISLGVADKVISKLKIVLKNQDVALRNSTYLYCMTNRNGKLNNSMFRSFDKVFNSAFASASSSSGSGGGFSSEGRGGSGGGVGALTKLFAVAENYPDLKVSPNFLDLQKQLKDTEDKISYSRQFYNDTAMKYNISIVQVPTSVIANLFGFKSRPYFKTEGEERENIEVKF